ncbi:T9SS type A sorting domain-containing protein [Pontibacter beigongshangensis]|uniref:T9SS type A sorting domain-containing protein n=1 Tax=Pontibacter beigongshangensis TaxID=2574733 RepID=UPI00164EE1EE|nr:T9SS type A sorting domain-containing protein [Pontibacter beigongshangensis]
MLMTGQASAQVFYDPFEGAGDIGGATEAAGTTNNGWTSHSNTKAGVIPIVEGSLSYTGLQAPAGNKVLLPGDNANVPRDVSAPLAFPAGTSVIYYSALLQVLDRTQLSTAAFDYFLHLGSSATTHLARLGIKGVNSRNNFRLAIQNAPGGSTSQTEFPLDLAYETTYLVVVKYDMRAAGNAVATLWVSPLELGGEESEEGVSNSSGTTRPASVTLISLRNSTNSPKAYLDEIRVGTTWASVTPAAVATSSPGTAAKQSFRVYPNPLKEQPLTIELPAQVAALDKVMLSVWSVNGKQLLGVAGSQEAVQQSLRAGVADLPAGVFIVKMVAGHTTYQAKIVKQ